jgi:hypothetical protein
MALCVDITKRDRTLPKGEGAVITDEEIAALRTRIRAELADRPRWPASRSLASPR